MELRKGYKKTEIGVIPEDWKTYKLKDITTITAGGTPSTFMNDYWGGEIKWMNSGEINKKFIYNVSGRITKLGFLNSSTKRIPKYCTLIGLAGQGKTRGTAAYNFIDLCINQSIAAIFPSNKFYSLYLYYNIDNRYLELRLLSSGQGGRGGLNLTLIGNLHIPLPPTLEEQKAIAEALSDTDELIEALDKLIEKKEAIKKGAMQELLTGKRRLPGFSGKWEEKRLGDLGFTYNGLTGKTKVDFEDGNSYYIPFLNVLNNTFIRTSNLEKVMIKSGEIQNKVSIGDLLFNTSSESPEEVGMASVLQESFENLYLNSFCFGYRIIDQTSMNSPFLSYLFRSFVGRRIMTSLAQGSTRYNLSKTKLLKVSIRLPEIQEQKAIAEILSDMDEEIEKLKIKRDKTNLIKEGMMQELLTGKTRLV